MGSYSQIEGDITIPAARLAETGNAIRREWDTLNMWGDEPDYDADPIEVITKAIDYLLKDEFGYLTHTPGTDGAPHNFVFGGEAKDTEGQELLLLVLTMHGATGMVEFDSSDGAFATILDGTEKLNHANAETVYPGDPDYTPPLNEAQQKALDTTIATLLNKDSHGDYDALRATVTDLVIALRNAPLVETDDDTPATLDA